MSESIIIQWEPLLGPALQILVLGLALQVPYLNIEGILVAKRDVLLQVAVEHEDIVL